MTRRSLSSRILQAMLFAVTAGRGYSADAEARARELGQVADQVFRSHGLSLSPQCRQWFTAFTSAGAERLQTEGANDAAMERARASMTRFAEQMVKDRMIGRGDVIDDNAFQKAKSALCPLYPFC